MNDLYDYSNAWVLGNALEGDKDSNSTQSFKDKIKKTMEKSEDEEVNNEE
jgi:hypothetical protein